MRKASQDLLVPIRTSQQREGPAWPSLNCSAEPLEGLSKLFANCGWKSEKMDTWQVLAKRSSGRVRRVFEDATHPRVFWRAVLEPRVSLSFRQLRPQRLVVAQ